MEWGLWTHGHSSTVGEEWGLGIHGCSSTIGEEWGGWIGDYGPMDILLLLVRLE